jgi:biopolymer transport protein ExbD
MSYRTRKENQEADLDITPFMNLMIVLVPVLLLSMVFSRITIIDLQLPEAAGTTSTELKQQQVELVIKKSGLSVNFPEGALLREIPFAQNETREPGQSQSMTPDYKQLSTVLQELKRHLREKGADRRNINFLIQDEAEYEQIIAAMDAARSYQTVVAASVVEAELFPDIAFVDLPNGTFSSKR